MKNVVSENEEVAFWSLDLNGAFEQVNSTVAGLTEKDIARRRKQYGANSITSADHQTDLLLFVSQFKSQTGKYSLGTTILVALLTLIIPWLPFAVHLGFWAIAVAVLCCFNGDSCVVFSECGDFEAVVL